MRKKSSITSVVFTIALLVLSGCAQQQKLQSRIPFPQEEYDALPKTGSARVTGEAFLKTVGGDIKYAAGNTVYLNPVTSYSKEWFQKQYVQGIRLVDADPRIHEYAIQAVADGQGKFEFINVPSGKFYLVTHVTWVAATGYKGALQQQGGLIVKYIYVDGGDNQNIILTKTDGFR
tara:strand:- start:142 stop:666 length:525 start_codon:yes stop_codon:yes gene_type:complete